MGEDGPSGDAGSGGDIGPKVCSPVHIHYINHMTVYGWKCLVGL